MDDELDRQIERSLRNARLYQAPEGLRRALGPRAEGLSRRRPSLAIGRGLAGLAATAVLAAALLVFVVSRSANLPSSSDGRLAWATAARPPAAQIVTQPVVVGDGLVVLTSDGRASGLGDVSVSVWSSADGSSWSRLSAPGAISEAGRSVSIAEMTSDGHGGLIAGGVTAVASDPTLALEASIWRSADGRTWSQSGVDHADGASIAGLASGPDRLVAVGLSQSGGSGASALAWYSSDGVTWQAASVSDSDGCSMLAVAWWQGEFVAIGSGISGAAPAWTSSDGRHWTRAGSLPIGFEVRRLLAFGAGLVAVGDLNGSPASAMTNDTQVWTRGSMPVGGSETFANVRPKDAVVLNGRLFAFGYSAVGTAPEATAAVASVAMVWISDDGLSWRLLPADATLAGEPSGAAVLGGRIVLATIGSPDSRVYAGTVQGS